MRGNKQTPATTRPRTHATAGKQHPRSNNSKAKDTKQHPQQYTRSSGRRGLLKAQFDPEQILRKPRKKRTRLPDSSVDYISPELGARSHSAAQLGTLWERIRGYRPIGLPDKSDSAGSTEEDPIETWYRNVGYLIPLAESAIEVLEQVLPPTTMDALKRKVYKTEGDRVVGLRERNVQIDPSLPRDPFLATFDHMQPHDLPGLHDLHEDVKQYHTDEWRLDLKKAIEDRLEATFQRTVMMSMFDRLRLIYNLKDDKKPILDFAVESVWNCPLMPTRALKKAREPNRQRVLSRPKPDISIAFHRQSIIGDGEMDAVPEATRRIMIYEGSDGNRTERAFPFLMIEAKNADKTANDRDARLQNLNSASQSLHCLYEFFNEADRKEVICNKSCCLPKSGDQSLSSAEDQSPSHTEVQNSSKGEKTFVERFLNEVRVFTAIVSGEAITIRVHRACLASKRPFPSCEGRPPFRTPILPDYPLQFEHNEVIKLVNDDREKLVNIFKKIMVDYGIGQLLPLMKDAAEKMSKKFYDWEEATGNQYEFGMLHYSHGQTAPSSQKSSRASSQATRSSNVAASNSQRSTESADSQTAHYSFGPQPVENPKSSKRRTRTR